MHNAPHPISRTSRAKFQRHDTTVVLKISSTRTDTSYLEPLLSLYSSNNNKTKTQYAL